MPRNKICHHRLEVVIGTLLNLSGSLILVAYVIELFSSLVSTGWSQELFECGSLEASKSF